MTQTESEFWQAAAEFDVARQRDVWQDMALALDRMMAVYFKRNAEQTEVTNERDSDTD